jgi:translation initiation factor 2B subunit (eIF-2B alpha/beta/delta family)
LSGVDAVLAQVERIAADETHGSSWLAREAVGAVVEAAQRGDDPLALAKELVRARPDIGAIAGALGRVLVAGRTTDQLAEEAEAILGSRERAAATIAVLLRGELEERIVMTHSASATAREALMHAGPGRVVCTVSDPGGEGRVFAEELAEAGLTTEVVADEDAEHAVPTVQLLLLGADTVFSDGSLLNKVKTSSLAKAAAKAEVPVIVACEVLKIAPVEPHPPKEDRVDLTPPERITQYVTEEGAFAPDEIAALIDRTPFLAEGYELLRD